MQAGLPRALRASCPSHSSPGTRDNAGLLAARPHRAGMPCRLPGDPEPSAVLCRTDRARCHSADPTSPGQGKCVRRPPWALLVLTWHLCTHGRARETRYKTALVRTAGSKPWVQAPGLAVQGGPVGAWGSGLGRRGQDCRCAGQTRTRLGTNTAIRRDTGCWCKTHTVLIPC